MISNLREATGSEMAFTYIFWAYSFAGLQLIAMSLFYKIKNFDAFRERFLPTAVLGPSMSLIGLGLVVPAVESSGFSDGINKDHAIVALATLGIVIFLSTTKRKFLKNTSIFASVVLGTIIAYIFFEEFRNFDTSQTYGLFSFSVPDVSNSIIQFVPNTSTAALLFVSVLPATALVFIENMSRVIMINALKEQDKASKANINAKEDDEQLLNVTAKSNLKDHMISTIGQGVSIIAASLFGSVPNTLYAENIAVMSIGNNDAKDRKKLMYPDCSAIEQINRKTSWVPFAFAAVLAIIFSFSGFLFQFLNEGIPDPVIGGISLFLFGIIAAPGIQLLVQGKVNYKKISNQVLTASVLIAGISTVELDLGFIILSNMSLGLTVGFVLNLLFMFLRRFGWLNESTSFGELFDMCIDNNDLLAISTVYELKQNAKFPPVLEDIKVSHFVNLSSDDYLRHSRIAKQPIENRYKYESEKIVETIYNSNYAEITYDGNPVLIVKQSDSGNLYLYVDEERLPENVWNAYKNDYPEIIEIEGSFVRIAINSDMSNRSIKKMIKKIWKHQTFEKKS